MLILFPVLVVEDSRRSLPTAPAESAVRSLEKLEFFASDPEVALPASRVIALFADRAPAFAALRELRFGFGLVAGTADHLASRSRSQAAIARGSNRTQVPTRKHGSMPACAWR